MIRYNDKFDPPAPVLNIAVTAIVQRRPRIEVPALVDTGSDMTAIPEAFVERLSLYPFSRIQVEGFSTESVSVFTYAARVILQQGEPQEVEVILTELPFAILGRDVLNEFYLYLQGPKQQFEVGTAPLDDR